MWPGIATGGGRGEKRYIIRELARKPEGTNRFIDRPSSKERLQYV